MSKRLSELADVSVRGSGCLLPRQMWCLQVVLPTVTASSPLSLFLSLWQISCQSCRLYLGPTLPHLRLTFCSVQATAISHCRKQVGVGSSGCSRKCDKHNKCSLSLQLQAGLGISSSRVCILDHEISCLLRDPLELYLMPFVFLASVPPRLD